jgi:hypothetical protein
MEDGVADRAAVVARRPPGSGADTSGSGIADSASDRSVGEAEGDIVDSQQIDCCGDRNRSLPPFHDALSDAFRDGCRAKDGAVRVRPFSEATGVALMHSHRRRGWTRRRLLGRASNV